MPALSAPADGRPPVRRKLVRMVNSLVPDRITRLRQRRTAPLILELDLTEGIAEEPPADPVSAILAMRRARLGDVLDGLRRARTDDRVRALIVKVGGRGIGLARVQELRTAIQEFGGTGKLTVAWAETFGDFSPGNVPYYLATAFDRIYLQPSGDVGLTGISMENWFYRGTMDKLGIDYQVGRRHEYKGAAERLTEHGFTGPAREAMERLAASVIEQITEAIGQRLEVSAGDARALVDRGPFLADEALGARLVDALGYRDEVYAEVRKEVGPDAYLLYLTRYQRARAFAQRARTLPNPGEDVIALIYATGPIRRGRSGRGPLASGSMGSDTMTAALRAAAADHRAQAIVLRVNSPGGSYIASDSIWREVVRAREAGKPVVVSMGDVAASGGYFIAMAADAIVAEPGTVTGSIGVLAGKPVLNGLLRRAGVSTDAVREGAHADMFSTTPPVQRRRVGAGQYLAGPDLRGLHRQGRRWPWHVRRAGARDRQGPGMDRGGRRGQRPRRRLGGLSTAVALARRKARPAGRRAAARVPACPPAGPGPPAGIE